MLSCLVIAISLWIYSPVFFGDWLWDDDKFITHNPLTKDPNGFWNVWLQPSGIGDFYPLTSAVRWLQWHFWGGDTLGYHLTNIGLHLTSAFLLWRLFHRLGLRLAYLGALIFTVHPLMVESVAWIAELKNTLSLPFLLLAMLFWLQYEDHRKKRDYFLALGLFFVAMLAKTSGLMLPVILLGYGIWKKRTFSPANFYELAPFFLVSLLAGLMTTFSHPTVPDPINATGGWISRWASVGWALLFMLGKCVYPVGLMPAYPGSAVENPSWLDFVPWLIFAATGMLIWRNRGTWGWGVMAGLGFFLINLIPVLGFILKNYARMVWSLDHLVYLPMIGLIGLLIAGIEKLQVQLSATKRSLLIGGICATVALFASASHWYVVAFSDEVTLWQYTVDRTPGFFLAEENLGKALLVSNQPEEARVHLEDGLKLKPDRADAHYELGQALVAMGKITEGMAEYDQAMKINPDDPEMENNLGIALIQADRIPEAKAHFERALQLRPEYALAYSNLGSAQAHQGAYGEAIKSFTHALAIDPRSVTGEDNLASALMKANRPEDAKIHFQRAWTLDPNDLRAKEGLDKLSQGH